MFGATLTGVILIMVRNRVQHRKWEQRRAEILGRAKKKGPGEFVL
jgi:hypothetical protein